MNIKELKKAISDHKSLMKKHGKQALKTMFDEFFAKHAEVERLTWTQYAPYFNDGDSCVFSVNELYVIMKESFSSEHISEDDYEEYDDERCLTSYNFKLHNPKLKKDLDAIESNLQSLENICEEVFGSDCRVSVYSHRIETEEYNHD